MKGAPYIYKFGKFINICFESTLYTRAKDDLSDGFFTEYKFELVYIRLPFMRLESSFSNEKKRVIFRVLLRVRRQRTTSLEPIRTTPRIGLAPTKIHHVLF